MHFPVTKSHILIVLSADPDTILEPSGAITREYKQLLCVPSMVYKHPLAITPQILILPSTDPDTIFEPSGVNAIHFTQVTCPYRVFRHTPVSKFQFLIDLSSDADTTIDTLLALICRSIQQIQL